MHKQPYLLSYVRTVATIFMAYSSATASNTNSPHKSQSVTSDNYQVTFILSQQVFEVSSISSHTGAQLPRHVVDCLVDDTLMQTRPDQAAIVRR